MWDHKSAKSWRFQPKKILHSIWRPNVKLIGSILESKSKEVIYTQNPSVNLPALRWPYYMGQLALQNREVVDLVMLAGHPYGYTQCCT